MFGYNSIGGAMATDHYTLKIKYGTSISRIGMRKVMFQNNYRPTLEFSELMFQNNYQPALEFSELEDTVRRKFKIPQTSELNMVYTDIDNDEVIITDDEDIQVAINQKLSPLRVTVRVSESHPLAQDDCPSSGNGLAAGKLDKVLLAVNKKLVEPKVELVKLVEPKVELVSNTESAKTEHHVLEGVDASTTADSIIEPSEDLTLAEDWTDIAQSGYDSEFLRRATILRQRVDNDELAC